MRVRRLPPVPVEESHKGLHDILIWKRIPDAQCDMNFRLPWRPTWRHGASLLQMILIAGLGGGLFTLLLQRVVAPMVASAVVLAGSYAVGGLLGLVRLACVARSGADRWTLFEQIVLWTMLPPMLWLAIAGVLLTRSRSGAIVYLAVVSIPAACLAADRMCTHVLYWTSANPQVELATLLTCREAWRKRFWWCVVPNPMRCNVTPLAPEFIRTLRSYPLRIPIVVIATLLPAILAATVFCHSAPFTQNVVLLAAMAVGLAAVGLLGTARYRRPLRSFTHYLLHWLHSGKHDAVPPWVFRSPLGSPMQRQAVCVAMLLLFAPAIIGLTGWMGLIPASGLDSSTDPAVSLPAAPALGMTAGHFLLRVLLLAVIPPVLFVLTLFAHAGPVICQFNRLLEGH